MISLIMFRTKFVLLMTLLTISGGIRLRYYKDKDQDKEEADLEEQDEEMYFDQHQDDDPNSPGYDLLEDETSLFSGSQNDCGITINLSHPIRAPSAEKRLTKFLLDNYRKIGHGGRPIVNSSLPLTVHFGLAMIQMDLDERDNTLTISVWCRYRWIDEYLSWNPADFDGVKSVRLSSKQIWLPDIMLYNTADTHKLERQVLVVVSHTGSVLWIPHRVYRSSCAVDITEFPFDRQTCQLTFGSWAYHGQELDLRFFDDLERMDISDLERENTEWEITAKSENRQIQYYDCCAEPYVTLVFTLVLRRKLVFSSFILTLPCIFLAFMTLVVFWLPAERPDRTSLAMNLFASFLLLLLILVEAAPPTASSVPMLGVYYCFNMILIMVSIFMSSVIININRRGAMHRVPAWLRAVSRGCLAKAFCTDLSLDKSQAGSRPHNQVAEDNPDLRTRSPSALMVGVDGACALQPQSTSEVSTTEASADVTIRSALGHSTGGAMGSFGAENVLQSHFLTVEGQLKRLEDAILDLCGSLKDKEGGKERAEIRLEWQVVALTLDRIFFWVFVVAIILSLLLLFPKPY